LLEQECVRSFDLLYGAMVPDRPFRLTNPATRLQYFWARVRTYGGEIEVVASPEVVEGTLMQGGVINGLFWLSGRLSEHRQTENNGLWNH
jgi:hypothetical protein